jgi:hypothetical protein
MMVVCKSFGKRRPGGIGTMEPDGGHHVARIDDTVTSANLHERAEAVAVPDFNYLEQTLVAIAVGLTRRRRRAVAAEPGRPAGDPAPVTGEKRGRR